MLVLWCAFASLFGFHFYLRLWARMGTMEWVIMKQQESEDSAQAAKRSQVTKKAAVVVAKKHGKDTEKKGSSDDSAKRGGSSSSGSTSSGKVGVEMASPPAESASSKGLVKSASRGDSTSEIALTQLPA